MSLVITNRLEPKVDLANGLITIDEYETNPLLNDDLSPTRTMLERHHRTVLETRDRMTRDALIKLGWTPPPERPKRKPAAECSDDARLRARAHDPGTSVAAADAAAAFAGSHKERILSALGEYELSTWQIAKRAGLTVVQVDRRIVELEREQQLEVMRADGREIERDGYRVCRRFRSPENKQTV